MGAYSREPGPKLAASRRCGNTGPARTRAAQVRGRMAGQIRQSHSRKPPVEGLVDGGNPCCPHSALPCKSRCKAVPFISHHSRAKRGQEAIPMTDQEHKESLLEFLSTAGKNHRSLEVLRLHGPEGISPYRCPHWPGRHPPRL